VEACHACGSYCVSCGDVERGGCARVRECSAVAEWVPALTPTPTIGPQRPLSEATHPLRPLTHPSLLIPRPNQLQLYRSSTPAVSVLRLPLRFSPCPVHFSLPYPCTCAIVLCRFASSRLGRLLYLQRALSARSRSPPLATESRILYYYLCSRPRSWPFCPLPFLLHHHQTEHNPDHACTLSPLSLVSVYPVPVSDSDPFLPQDIVPIPTPSSSDSALLPPTRTITPNRILVEYIQPLFTPLPAPVPVPLFATSL